MKNNIYATRYFNHESVDTKTVQCLANVAYVAKKYSNDKWLMSKFGLNRVFVLQGEHETWFQEIKAQIFYCHNGLNVG